MKSLELAVNHGLKSLKDNPAIHKEPRPYCSRNDVRTEPTSNKTLYQLLEEEAARFRELFSINNLETHKDITVDGAKVGSVLLSPAASPHVSETIKDIYPPLKIASIFERIQNLPFHLVVWWDDLNPSNTTDMLTLEKFPSETHAAFIDTISRTIDEAVVFFKHWAELSHLEEADYEINIYGLTGYSSRDDRLKTSLGRGAQSSSHGHCNVALQLTESGRKKLYLPSVKLFSDKGKNLDKVVTDVTKFIDPYSYLPFLEEKDRCTFDNWLLSYITQHVTNRFTTDITFTLTNSPYSLEFSSESVTTTKDKMDIISCIEAQLEIIYQNIRLLHEYHWKHKLKIVTPKDYEKVLDTIDIFPSTTIDVLTSMFDKILPTRRQIEHWGKQANKTQRTERWLKAYSSLHQTVSSEYDMLLASGLLSTELIMAYLRNSLYSPLHRDGHELVLPPQVFSGRLSTSYELTANGASIALHQGQKGFVEKDGSIIYREEGK